MNGNGGLNPPPASGAGSEHASPSVIRGVNRIFAVTLAQLRGMVRRTRTGSTSPGAARKLYLTLLMLPPFSAIVLLLRVRLALRGPISVTVRTEEGDWFDCHPPDLIQLYLWMFGVWEPDLTHFIRQRLRPGDVFVDVGANIGYFSVVAARRVGAAGRVVAIEASPRVFASLEQTVRENSVSSSVRVINVAAAARAGSIPIFAGPAHNTGLASTVERWGRPQQATVDAMPVDDLLERGEISRARIVKIDVEGGEDQVLAGMVRVIRDAPRELEILVELSPRWWSDSGKRPLDVIKPFLDAGFHAYAMENSYWPWRYLWPSCVPRPRRIRGGLRRRKRRMDLVLSREDSDFL